MKSNELTSFEENEIRKVWHEEQWYFSVIDVIGVLTESNNHQTYWYVLKKREPQLLTVCKKLKLVGQDGKARPSDCANAEGVLRIVMSVPSPKAEPLKLWLAAQGKRAIDETEDPELSFDRMTEIYRAKGHTDKWIKERIQSITTRKQLTDEWKQRGVKEGQEFSILTATIAKGTFGLSPSEHSKLKGLDKENLRDHMTPIELILTSLSEEVTRMITVKDDAKGFNENLDAAVKGGQVGRTALKNVEKSTGEKVVSATNFLNSVGGDKLDELPAEKKDKSDL
jgi:DNA-damage-inducible protein D